MALALVYRSGARRPLDNGDAHSGAGALADDLRRWLAAGHTVIRVGGWCVVHPAEVVAVVDTATGETVRVWPDEAC